MIRRTVATVFAAVFALAACGEKPQTAGARKSDTAAYQGTGTSYVAQGWKAGDSASWEAQMKARAQGQDEYTRTRQ